MSIAQLKTRRSALNVSQWRRTRRTKFYWRMRSKMPLCYADQHSHTFDLLFCPTMLRERKDERPWERGWSTTTLRVQRHKVQSTRNVRCDFVMTFNKICLTFTIAASKEYSSTWRRFILPLHLRYRKVREFFENF